MTRRSRYDTELGRNVTRMIAEATTTQVALARQLGMTRSGLNHMLTGRRPASPDLEARVLRALSKPKK